MANPIDIQKIFPVYKVEHDAILSGQGDMTLVYQLQLPEIFTLSDTDYQSYHQSWVKAIRLLPEGTVLCKQDWFTVEGYTADFSAPEASMLSRSSEHFFNGRPGMQHQCFLMLTWTASTRRTSSSGYSGLLRKTAFQPGMLSGIKLNEFADHCSAFTRVLQDSGFVTALRLLDQELTGTGNRPGLLEKYTFLQTAGDKSIRDIHLKDGIRIGEQQCTLFSLADTEQLPSFCGPRINYDQYSTDRSKFSVGFSACLGQLLPCNHIYSQYLFISDSAKTIKQLEAKKLRLQSLSAYSRENAVSRDAVNEFLNEAVAQGRQPVKAHFNLLVFTDDPLQQKNIRNLVSSAFARMDASVKIETDGAPQIWWAGIPGNGADFPMNDTFDTFLEQACCFLNLESCYRSSRSPFGIRLGERLTGSPVHVDISDEPMRLGLTTNRNKFILGPSGSGKSFFTNHMVRSYYEQGAHLVLVDVGHSYRGLCELLGGYYFSYEESNPIQFNPFHLGEGEVLDTEKKESVKTLLLALWKKEEETYRRSEYVAISNALTQYYQYLDSHPEVFAGFNTFYEFLSGPYFEVLESTAVKEKDFDLSNFLYVLNPYYRGGEFDYLLNATENLDLLSERMVVFELDNVKNHPILFPVITIIIMEVFISKMRKLKGIRKVLLLEEAWKAIAKEGMAQYMQYLVKTVRKHFGEFIVVTQEVEDIISSPIVKQAILANSDCKILLDQRKYQNKFDQIQELLGLTEKEKAQILSMNRANDPARQYKEVFISLGSQLSKVYRTEVSLEEYLCYTTEESEKISVAQYAARYGNMQKGIQMLAIEMREEAITFKP